MLVDLFEEKKEDSSKFISYLVFEPASLRVPDNDILLLGDQAIDLFETIINNNDHNSSMENQILLNRLQRVQMMIDLLKDTSGLVMTKFLNRIWRRHAFFSHLGELFITKKDLDSFAPKYKFNEPLFLDRVVQSEFDEEAAEDDDNNSSDEDSNKDSNDDSNSDHSKNIKDNTENSTEK